MKNLNLTIALILVASIIGPVILAYIINEIQRGVDSVYATRRALIACFTVSDRLAFFNLDTLIGKANDRYARKSIDNYESPFCDLELFEIEALLKALDTSEYPLLCDDTFSTLEHETIEDSIESGYFDISWGTYHDELGEYFKENIHRFDVFGYCLEYYHETGSVDYFDIDVEEYVAFISRPYNENPSLINIVRKDIAALEHTISEINLRSVRCTSETIESYSARLSQDNLDIIQSNESLDELNLVHSQFYDIANDGAAPLDINLTLSIKGI